MSIKHYCDVCEAEIGGDHSVTEGEVTLKDQLRRPWVFAVRIELTRPASEPPMELCGGCVATAAQRVAPMTGEQP